MAPLYDEFSFFHVVLCNLILIQRPVSPASILQDLTLHDFHQAALPVLQLLTECHNRICFCHIGHQGLVRHIHRPFTQGDHSPVSSLTAVGMNGGNDCHAGTGCLLRRIGLWPTHLSNHNHIRIETQRHVKQRDLIHTLPVILAVPGNGVNDRVCDLPILLPNQVQLSGAGFYGVDSLMIWNCGEEPPHQGCLSGAGCTGYADRDPIPYTLC